MPGISVEERVVHLHGIAEHREFDGAKSLRLVGGGVGLVEVTLHGESVRVDIHLTGVVYSITVPRQTICQQLRNHVVADMLDAVQAGIDGLTRCDATSVSEAAGVPFSEDYARGWTDMREVALETMTEVKTRGAK